MENGKKLEFPEGQEGVRGNQGFPQTKWAQVVACLCSRPPRHQRQSE